MVTTFVLDCSVTVALAFGDEIKVYREYRQISQEQLALKIGKTKQYISAIESGIRNGTIETLKKLSKALNVDLDILK
jgi:transcriptional regulator with XRE-family HTH domain